MFPGINPKQLEKAMKKMGVKQETIDAKQVIIKTEDKELIINNPHVMKVEMMGQESLQIIGDIEERELKKYNDEDVKTVMEKAQCTEEEAIKSLEENDGDIAASIISITQ